MKKIFLLAVIISFSLFFVFHYSLIILSAGPTNPISAKYNNISNKYTSTVFSQNWHLFAPDPVNRNNHIYVQFTKDISEEESDQWIDITNTFIDINKNKIITPYNRTIRLVDGMFMDAEGSSYMEDLTIKYINNSDDKKSDTILNKVEKQIEMHQNFGEESLHRFASSYVKSFMNNVYTDNQYIRIKLTAYGTTPFSERNNKNYKEKIEYSKTFEWEELKNVAPIH